VKAPRKLLLIATSILAFSTLMLASATDVYITPDGSAQGVCTSNQQTPAWFNNSSNWGSGNSQIGPGTTVHLCGTFTGTPGQTLFAFQGSGASGNPTTLIFEAGANLTAPYWGGAWTNYNSAAIFVNNQSWITINGGTNGTIQNTQNGTGLTYPAANTTGVEVAGSSNIIVENLTVANMCQRSAGDSGSGGEACNVNVDAAGIVIAYSSSVTVQYNTVHDAHDCMYYSNGGEDSNVTFQYNTLSRCNWAIGVNGSGTSNGVNIVGNDITCVVGAPCNWDDPNDSNHHNGLMMDPQSGNTLSHVTIANNYFHDINGNTTAYIFLDASGSGNVPSNLIYNNVFFTSPGQSGPANGMVTSGTIVTGTQTYNNTFYGPGARAWSADINNFTYNNIAVGESSAEYYDSGASGSTTDYNDFYSSIPYVAYNGGSGYTNLPLWQTASTSVCTGSGCDLHSIASNPSLNNTSAPPNLTLQSGSGAIASGKNLTSLGITGLDQGAPQSFGVNYTCGTGCAARPSTGAWDMGAYPSSSANGNPPAPPTGLAAQVQ
jgi:hypothetical protein